MTVAAQPQFSTAFSHDISGSIAGTFGALAGATPGTAPRGKRLGNGRPAAGLPRKLVGKLTGNWPFRPVPQDHAPAQAPGHVSGSSQTRPVPEQGSHAAPVGKAVNPAEVSVREMVTDVLLVGMWAAMIPGMMWLGSALGF
ncbi:MULTISPECIES: hypothetical protein [unclassified Achromobacter]|uniref:hypothetical protein n=1 Tax=unclassified Achromobacter TaxID=2626865 RepID=UPI000B51CE46|nr:MULTISPECIES: hypothetical protein [unclassified Achromobacter]OWT70244.1 hypothetical protein CEY05_26765 [Achromobacter sp. HZ34]OWT71784.1 hypothetical protein CEY04_25600 [Achromobacter sp. HZ28]